MAKYLNLRIPERCHEDWNAMLPDQGGKFCFSCQKKVVDFTSLSDRELIEFFKNHKGSACGRFHAEQLNRDIRIPGKKIPWIKYFFQFTIPAFLLSLKTAGQSVGKVLPKVEASPVYKGETASVVIDTSKAKWVISGTVKDEKGQPVPGASIMIKGTKSGVAADTLGKFSLEGIGKPVELQVSAIGYTIQELQLPAGQTEVNVFMSQQLMGFLGGVVVVKSRLSRKRKIEKKEVCVKPTPPTLSVYPNPLAANNPLHLQWQNLKTGSYFVEIYSLSGALVQSQNLQVESETSEFVLEAKLLAGNYIVAITSSKTGLHLSKQIIVN